MKIFQNFCIQVWLDINFFHFHFFRNIYTSMNLTRMVFYFCVYQLSSFQRRVTHWRMGCGKWRRPANAYFRVINGKCNIGNSSTHSNGMDAKLQFWIQIHVMEKCFCTGRASYFLMKNFVYVYLKSRNISSNFEEEIM